MRAMMAAFGVGASSTISPTPIAPIATSPRFASTGRPPTRYLSGPRARRLGCRERDDRASSGGPFLADHLVDTELVPEYEWGAVDRALVAADPDAGPVPLTRRDGRRVTVVEAYLDPIRSRPNLDVVSDVHVDRVVFDGRRAIGVRDGRRASSSTPTGWS